MDGKTQTVEDPPVLSYQTNMWFQIKTFLTSILLLIALCFGASANFDALNRTDAKIIPVGSEQTGDQIKGGLEIVTVAVSGAVIKTLKHLKTEGKSPNSTSSRTGGKGATNNADDVIPTIGGRKPINFEWAGKTHPSGIEFDNQGFPKFETHAKATVKSNNLTGVYAKDERIALEATGLSKTPDGFTWHHHQDGKSLLLVPKDLHSACRHTGGCAVIRNGGGFD